MMYRYLDGIKIVTYKNGNREEKNLIELIKKVKISYDLKPINLGGMLFISNDEEGDIRISRRREKEEGKVNYYITIETGEEHLYKDLLFIPNTKLYLTGLEKKDKVYKYNLKKAFDIILSDVVGKPLLKYIGVSAKLKETKVYMYKGVRVGFARKGILFRFFIPVIPGGKLDMFIAGFVMKALPLSFKHNDADRGYLLLEFTPVMTLPPLQNLVGLKKKGGWNNEKEKGKGRRICRDKN